MDILIYLLIGSVSGFVAGLFGIGGGLVIIPCLYVAFRYFGIPYEVIMHLAVGTAMASIIVSSLSSALAQHKKKAILWNLVSYLVPTMMIGSLLGAWIADMLPSHYMQLLIGLFACWTAYKMFVGAKANSQNQDEKPQISVLQHRIVGGLIGMASSIFGIAGGSIIVPYLNRCGIVMQNAVATSSACGVPIALMGAIGYLWFGSRQNIDVAHTIGYIHVYAFLGISIASFITAKLGVKIAHAISAARLKKYFAIELLLVGLYFTYQFGKAWFVA
ncbi:MULTISPECIES: sulfite exporter TauE/SafE family protein [unclassified Acinetobacter]|uniref:sulfite exporter TauE/SafE family protein n=1 Tax=unclassified Acinetobacter TaxID=196816 RepID=UPI0035B83ECE